jgi:glucosamine-phosphate N-acetyltransferase
MIRPIQLDDYQKGYTNLLQVLTKVPEMISYTQFQEIIDTLGPRHQIFVMEENNTMIATMTCWIEKKMIHGGSNVLHVEDVIVHPDYQKRGIGKMLLDETKIIAMKEKCYKIILDCVMENKKFYENCGFTQKQVQMSFYLD